MIGKLISHYQIVEKIGQGGMGVVYKAHDTELNRFVALKFLPENLAGDSIEKERFYHEARAASALNHPNIMTIHEVGKYEDQFYIVMEYLEGQTLRKFIGEIYSQSSDSGKPASFPIKNVLDVAIQICDGLAAAHEKGVVHRDIKSDNIMITNRGKVKIMDFGLAKLEGATKLTKTGSTIGTAAYMSPEQARGEDADGRSDIFSFGVVLYEMLTGRLPFRGEHPAALMYSVVHEDPVPVTTFNNEAPLSLEQIVVKMLAKNREERFQDADILLTELRSEREAFGSGIKRDSTIPISPSSQSRHSAIGSVRTLGKKYKTLMILAVALIFAVSLLLMFNPFNLRITNQKNSVETSGRIMIAVLPFENLGAPTQDYFADGVTEEIASRLSNLSGLGVIARTSSMQYKKTQKPLKQIGTELGVQYLLEGSIRWANSVDGSSRVRITTQVIKIEDGTQVWSQIFESPLADIFQVQGIAATQVAEALNIRLAQREKTALLEKATINTDLYSQYLKAFDTTKYSPTLGAYKLTETLISDVIKKDSTFVAAYIGLVEISSWIYWQSWEKTPERQNRIKFAAERAVRLQPAFAGAHHALGLFYYRCLRDYENAGKEFDTVAQLEPSNANNRDMYGAIKRRQGKYAEAMKDFKTAFILDPLNAQYALDIGQTYFYMRDFKAGEEYLTRSITLDPQSNAYILKASNAFARDGNTLLARKALEESAGKTDQTPMIFANVVLDMYDGKYLEAINRLTPDLLKKTHADTLTYYTRKGFLYKYLNDVKSAQTYFDSLRIIVERRLQAEPANDGLYSARGIADAGLGKKENALQAGRKANELVPISKDAMTGMINLEALAMIESIVGEYDSALDHLEILLSMPGKVSVNTVRLDPVYAPLRSLPRFQKLIASHNNLP
ncbi:MAG: protein kinase [Bacteroidota bacterium]